MSARIGPNDGFPGASSIGAIIRGAALSFGVSFLGAVLLGLAVSLTAWEGFSFDLRGFSYVSVALGGMLAAKRSRRFGWLHGGGVGLLYFLLSAALFQGDFEWAHLLTGQYLLKALGSFGAGALGGVLGVNF